MSFIFLHILTMFFLLEGLGTMRLSVAESWVLRGGTWPHTDAGVYFTIIISGVFSPRLWLDSRVCSMMIRYGYRTHFSLFVV
ncbi:hypothetical protein DER46DRAFT_617001, partial [Fusarium sp. MPI-SDFR-AT-0072]